MKTISFALCAWCLACLSLSWSQTGTTTENNRIIIKYFPGHQLPDMAINNPELYNDLHTYFASSFVVKRIDCKNCNVDYDELLNFDLFDVRSFESFRADNQRITIDFKPEKYTISLLSAQELSTLLQGASFETLMLQSFPKWRDTGLLEEDYESYKKNVAYWSSSFPELFRTLTSANETMKIRFHEFSSMSQTKRDTFTTTYDLYYITD